MPKKNELREQMSTLKDIGVPREAVTEMISNPKNMGSMEDVKGGINALKHKYGGTSAPQVGSWMKGREIL